MLALSMVVVLLLAHAMGIILVARILAAPALIVAATASAILREAEIPVL